MRASQSLSRRVALFTSLGFAVVVVLSVLVMAAVLRVESDEQRDDALREMSPFVMALLTRAASLDGQTEMDAVSPALSDLDGHETILVFALVDQNGVVRASSQDHVAFPYPKSVGTNRFYEDETYRYFISPPNENGAVVILGDALGERAESVFESLLGFVGPMVPLVAISFLLVRWVTRSALRPLNHLRDEIAARDRGLLSPVDSAGLPSELHTVVATLNGFMSRLSKALDAERHFATNAAHELRTPLAVALAKVQHLKSRQAGRDVTEIEAVEQALKRMSRLVERLLQLGRAEAGAGTLDKAIDLREVLELVVDERAGANPEIAARLDVHLSDAPVMSKVSADDFAIVASNLIDNALRYAAPNSPVSVVLEAGALTVSNAGEVIAADELSTLTTRFKRHDARGGGLGLGLYISDTLARNLGGDLTLQSPAIGARDGVSAVFTFPRDEPRENVND
ncbi:sensor histidine kinase [Celeribacter sp.]|uniref:sensor histidine kinase n=1 Tax=Celeribacter sp. TaxID=1890673 RepID=UPI003A8D68F9